MTRTIAETLLRWRWPALAAFGIFLGLVVLTGALGALFSIAYVITEGADVV